MTSATFNHTSSNDTPVGSRRHLHLRAYQPRKSRSAKTWAALVAAVLLMIVLLALQLFN